MADPPPFPPPLIPIMRVSILATIHKYPNPSLQIWNGYINAKPYDLSPLLNLLCFTKYCGGVQQKSI